MRRSPAKKAILRWRGVHERVGQSARQVGRELERERKHIEQARARGTRTASNMVCEVTGDGNAGGWVGNERGGLGARARSCRARPRRSERGEREKTRQTHPCKETRQHRDRSSLLFLAGHRAHSNSLLLPLTSRVLIMWNGPTGLVEGQMTNECTYGGNAGGSIQARRAWSRALTRPSQKSLS